MRAWERDDRRAPGCAIASLEHAAVRAVERCDKRVDAASIKRHVSHCHEAARRASSHAQANATQSLRTMTADSPISVRELDCRWTNGIQVRLLWCQFDGRVSVAVMDSRTRDSFCIDVPEGERPLDVFYHPFAYAAHQRVTRHLA